MQAECSLSPPGSQVFERVNADGVYCSLITGQERKKVPFARHSACTIEMANLATPVEVAVVDEIQVGGRRGQREEGGGEAGAVDDRQPVVSCHALLY